MLHLTLLLLSNPQYPIVQSTLLKVSDAPPPHAMPMYSSPYSLSSLVLPHNLRSRVTLVSALLRCAKAFLETFLDVTHESACLRSASAKASIIAFLDTFTRSEIDTTCLNACLGCRAKASIIARRGTCSGSNGLGGIRSVGEKTRIKLQCPAFATTKGRRVPSLQDTLGIRSHSHGSNVTLANGVLLGICCKEDNGE